MRTGAGAEARGGREEAGAEGKQGEEERREHCGGEGAWGGGQCPVGGGRDGEREEGTGTAFWKVAARGSTC